MYFLRTATYTGRESDGTIGPKIRGVVEAPFSLGSPTSKCLLSYLYYLNFAVRLAMSFVPSLFASLKVRDCGTHLVTHCRKIGIYEIFVTLTRE